MSIKRTSRKVIAGLAVATAVTLSAGVAFAFWTGTGTGTGSATVAGGNGSVSIDATVVGAAPYPGSSNDVTFKAYNTGATSLKVGTIHLDSVSADGGHSGCAVADFSMADVTSPDVIAANTSQANEVVVKDSAPTPAALKGTLVYTDSTTVNQDACKGATITLHLSSNSVPAA